MKTIKHLLLFCLAFYSISGPAVAADGGEVRLQPGEMGFAAFLEMISERLDLEIDASDAESGRITVPDAGLVSVDSARAIALTVLHLEGYTWIQDPPTGIYRVLRQRDARDQELPFITDAKNLADNDLLVTYLLPIQNTSPEYVARNLRSFMPANSRIIPDEATGSVLITDSSRNIAKLGKLVERLDTPEAAKQASEWLESRVKEASEACQDGQPSSQGPSNAVLISLFSLIALVIGFLSRGYVIRRIEGGL